VARKPNDQLDLAALRALALKKPRTKAGQVRQAWPEIRQLLASGHKLKDVCAWLKEIGLDIQYNRLSEYVIQLRRADAAPAVAPIAAAIPAAHPAPEAAAPTAPGEPPTNPPKRDPLANLRRSEANRPGFHYRPYKSGDEKDLI
jgi:hypothetical protein